MSDIESKRAEASARRQKLEEALAGLGDIVESADPAAWVLERDSLRLRLASARADELRAEIELIEVTNADLREQQLPIKVNVEMIESELKAVQERLREARRELSGLTYEVTLNIDRKRAKQRDLDAVLVRLRNEAAPVVRARNVQLTQNGDLLH